MPIVLLAGCASDAPQVQAQKPLPDDRVVVGSGTTDDRKVINATDQQMFNAEHATDPDPAASSNTQAQNPP